MEKKLVYRQVYWYVLGEVHYYAQRALLINYNETKVTKMDVTCFEEILALDNTNSVTCHSLILEDIINMHQWPRLDDHEDYNYKFLAKVVCNLAH